MPVRPDDYDEIIARINRKYDGDLKRGDEIENAARIPTGSLELDVAMGGGMPIGRWARFFGGYHSTKTLRALTIAKHAQEMGMLVAYYNIEKQYDPEFTADQIGVNTKELTVVEGSTIEEITEKMEALFGVVHLHIIDSCSAAVSEDELNADVRDWRPGISARAWGRSFRRLNERFDQNENTVIMIDQVRVNFKTGSEEAPGGKILDHQSSMTVHFKKGKWLFKNKDGYLDEKAKGDDKSLSGGKDPDGYEIQARVVKSRVCRPFRSARMHLDLDSIQFDPIYEDIKAAKHYGLLRVAGGGHYYDAQTGEKVAHGEPALRRYFEEHRAFRDEIREVAIAASHL